MKIAQKEHMGSILLVDDEADSRDALRRYLERVGFIVRSAPNGREALIAVATTVPDVIVLDVMMPEMNGMEFLQVIRSYLRWQTIPVILLTAFDKGEHMERANQLGVSNIFLKASYNMADLAQCIFQIMADPKTRCDFGAA